MSRPRRQLSKGIRIYYHYRDGVRVREALNAAAGIQRAHYAALIWGVKAIGNESGAATIHVHIPCVYAGA